MLRIEQTGHVFRERLSAQRVCVGSVGQIGQPHLEGPPAGALAQLSLRSRRVRGPYNARVHRRGGGCLRVHHACADPAWRPEGTIGCRGIDDRVGGPHQEAGNQRGLIFVAHPREHRIGRHALTHEGGDTGNLSRRLASARHPSIVIAGDGSVDVPSRCSDFRLEPHVRAWPPRGGTPRREAVCPLQRGAADGSHREDGGIGSGCTNCTQVTHARAPLGSPAVSHWRVNRDTRAGKPGKDVVVQCRRFTVEITIRHEGHADRVRLQNHRIIEGRQQVTVTHGPSAIRENLGEDELRIGRTPLIGRSVGCRERRHASAMSVHRKVLRTIAIADGWVRVAVRIVVDERNLVTDPCAALTGIQLGREGLHLVLR